MSKKNTPQANVPKSESQGASLPHDKNVWQRLDDVIKAHGHNFQHVLELWPAYVRRLHLSRFLAHYELFKNIIDLPGCVVELGVYRAPSLMTWTKLMETFCPGDRKRTVYGFDSFEGLQDFDDKDGKEDPLRGKHIGGYSPGAVQQEVEELVAIANQDGFIPASPRCKLVLGNIEETLPKFLEENPGLRISLLHFDVDLYRPTKIGLELLYPLVVKGGVVILDEYGLVPWQGESNAVDEYFDKIGEKPVIKKFEYATQPHGYFIK